MYNNTNNFEQPFLQRTALWIKPTSWLQFEGRLGYDYYDTYTKQVVLFHGFSEGFGPITEKNAKSTPISGLLQQGFGDNLLNINAVLRPTQGCKLYVFLLTAKP